MRQVNELLVERDEVKEFDQAYSSRNLGEKSYELSNHLGNVLAVVSDKKKADGTADVKAVYDYYPFGMQMPSRSFNSEDYRFGFNGKEKDPEGLGGSGTTYDYGFRIYNPNIAKFLSIDPLYKTYPYYSSYQYAGNSPVAFIDLDGLERVLAITFNGDVNYRAENLEILNGEEISKKVLTNDPATQIAEAFKEASKADENGIGFVAIWGHGTPHSQWGTNSSRLLKGDLSKLEEAIENGEVSFTDNAIIYIGNCNAGTNSADGTSFAQRIADMTGVKVVAGSTDAYDTRDHAGSVGVSDETNGNMKYTMWSPKLDNFQLYERNSEPTPLEGTIDVALLLERGKYMPLDIQSKPRLITLPETKLPLPEVNIQSIQR
jgi:RHS repeat-associated protein